MLAHRPYLSVRHLQPDDPAVARATMALGRVLEERGSYTEAIIVLDDAARLHASRDPESADLAATLRELVNSHFYAGNLATAEEIGRRTLAMTRKVNGERHALVAEDLISLGAAQHERGQYAEAERYYREALAISESWYGKDHYKTASNLTMLGRTLQLEKQFDEAGVVLRRAVAIQERVFGPMHPRVASAVNDLGSVAQQRREFSRAEPLYRDAIAMFVQTQSPQHLNTGIGRIKLGRALVGEQRYAEAERELLAGYEILMKQTSPSVPWLRAAREDLVKLYTASKQPEKAKKFETESRQ